MLSFIWNTFKYFNTFPPGALRKFLQNCLQKIESLRGPHRIDESKNSVKNKRNCPPFFINLLWFKSFECKAFFTGYTYLLYFGNPPTLQKITLACIACLCFEIGVCLWPDLSSLFQYTSPTPVVSLHLIPRIQYHPGIPLPCSQGLVFSVLKIVRVFGI